MPISVNTHSLPAGVLVTNGQISDASQHNPALSDLSASITTALTRTHDHAQEIATTSASGHMSATDKARLDSLYLNSSGLPAVLDVPGLLANTTFSYTVGAGLVQVFETNILQTRTEGFSYRVAAAGATNHHLVTANGVKLYAMAIGGMVFASPQFNITGVGDESAKLQAMVTAATTVKRALLLAMVNYSTEIILPEGVWLYGPRSAGIKRINQVRTTTTSAISSGSGSVSFTVASATGLAIGQSLMFIESASIVKPDVNGITGGTPLNPIITAISGNSITINRRSTFGVVSGATIQTASHGIIVPKEAKVSGITIDGNTSNQTDSCWYNQTEICMTGNDSVVDGCAIINTPSDGILVIGTATRTARTKITNNIFENIGCNGVHYGATLEMICNNNYFYQINRRWESTFTNIAALHQDGAIIFSNDCDNLIATGNTIIDSLHGVGSLGSLGAVTNNKVTATENHFHNVRYPLYVSSDTTDVVFSNNRVSADYPYLTFMSATCKIYITGNSTTPLTSARRIEVCDNVLNNADIHVGAYIMGAAISGNTIDRTAVLYTDGTNADGIYITNSKNVNCTLNTIIGGATGIRLQSNFAVASGTLDNNLVSGNTLLNQRFAGIFGVGSTSNYFEAHVTSNIITTDATSIGPSAYYAIHGQNNMTAQGNKIRFPTSGLPVAANAWNTSLISGTPDWKRYNFINGAWE